MTGVTDRTIEAASELGQGQRLRLSFDDGSTSELRVDQMEYLPNERLRLELTSVDPTDSDRYRAEAHVEGGDWTPLAVWQYDRDAGAWTTRRRVDEVIPLETFRTVKSSDMEAQERTGTAGDRHQ